MKINKCYVNVAIGNSDKQETKGHSYMRTFVTTAVNELKKTGKTIVYSREQVDKILSILSNLNVKHDDFYYEISINEEE